MKHRSTTSVSLSFAARMCVVVAVVLATIAAPLQLAPIAKADRYDDQIAALTRDMARYQAEADRLNGEAISLQNALAKITNDKNALQSQVDLTQAQYDKLTAEIVQTEKDIANNQGALGGIIADLYVDSGISPLEMIASSKNIGDYIDKQEYRNSIRDQLTKTIKKVKALKERLKKQKQEVETLLAKLKSDRDALAAKEAEQANLLATTRNDEAAYQGLVRNSAAKIAEARATQAALRARTNATGGYQLVNAGSLGAYPWNQSNCPMLGWMSTGGANGNGGDGHGYGCRQCASYSAWRVARATGIYYQNWGNGGNHAAAAINAGYTNYGGQPAPGTSDYVAVMWGNPGHVAYVEQVSADGSKVLVSQYNYDYGAGYGMYSEMWLSTGFFNQYVKIK